MSEKEKEIVVLLAKNGKMKTKDIVDSIGAMAKTFSVQRDRLVKKGIIDGREYRTVSLLLPRFEEFVQTNYYEV